MPQLRNIRGTFKGDIRDIYRSIQSSGEFRDGSSVSQNSGPFWGSLYFVVYIGVPLFMQTTIWLRCSFAFSATGSTSSTGHLPVWVPSPKLKNLARFLDPFKQSHPRAGILGEKWMQGGAVHSLCCRFSRAFVHRRQLAGAKDGPGFPTLCLDS